MKYCRYCNEMIPWGRKLCTPCVFASRLWNNLLGRCQGKRDCYRGVEVRMTKPEFMAWVRPELMRFWHEHRGESASIDRTAKHYEIGSIRVVSKRTNSGKTSKSRIKTFREFVELWFWIKRSYEKDTAIARRFRLSPQTVGRIRAGETYREYIEMINRGEHRPKMIE